MASWIPDVLLVVAGYLLGSLPFALWVTHLRLGVDVRAAGSGHATATNTMRQAGWLAGVLVVLLDAGKGYLATWLALQFAEFDWVVPIAAAFVVVGHCWPVFASFRGGMGLATAAGSFLAISPLGFVIALGVIVSLTLILRHSARASVIAGLILAPIMWVLGLEITMIWAALGVGLVIAVRFLSDWNRQYRELWLDRERT